MMSMTTQDHKDSDVKSFVKNYKAGLAAGSSSVVSTLVAFPLDSIKTRMQTYPFASYWDCFTQTAKNEGAKGFWRGSLAPLLSITVVRTISFSIYTSSQNGFNSAIRKTFGEDVYKNDTRFPRWADIAQWSLSGATAGAAVSVIACPFEFTKLNAQIEYLLQRDKAATAGVASTVHLESAGTYQSAKRIVASRGLRGLYSGFHLHVARDTAGTAIYFTLYESFKKSFSGKATEAGPWVIAASGGLCGILSWLVVYPVDSYKSNYQKNILRLQPGQPVPKMPFQFDFHRMYRGLGISVTRSCLINALFFSSLERITKTIDKL